MDYTTLSQYFNHH